MSDVESTTENEELHIQVSEEDLVGQDLQITAPVIDNDTSNNNVDQVDSPVTAEPHSGEKPDENPDTEMEQPMSGESGDHGASNSATEPETRQEAT